MTKRAKWGSAFALAVVLLGGTSGCMTSASDECAPAWESSPDEGNACESSRAALTDEQASADAQGTAAPEASGGTTTTADTTAPRDSVSGNATGRRAYKQVVFTAK